MADTRRDLHCPRCGMGLVEQPVEGQPRLVCPACQHVHYRQLKVGAGVLVQQEGMLLLLQRGPNLAFPGSWNLPAGYCEADESPRATAAREAEEETGLVVRPGDLVDVYYFDDDARGNGLFILYEAEIVAGELRCDGNETVAAGFFAAGKLPQPICGGGHNQAVRAWERRAQNRWQPGAPMRYCPHCAHALTERHAFDRRRPVCPQCGFVHFREPKVGVSVLVEQEGQVLLVQRAVDPGRGQWGLPSGFVEWDEAPTATAIRECQEETGLRIRILELLDVVHYADDFRGQGINLTYRAQATGGLLQPADDAKEAQFFAPENLPPPEQIAFVTHRAALEQWRSLQTG